jgi:hypothetical protein
VWFKLWSGNMIGTPHCLKFSASMTLVGRKAILFSNRMEVLTYRRESCGAKTVRPMTTADRVVGNTDVSPTHSSRC